MEAARQPLLAGASSTTSRMGTPGRGRGRARLRRPQESDNGTKTEFVGGGSVGQKRTEHSPDPRHVEVKQGQFEDTKPNRPLEQNPHRLRHSHNSRPTPVRDIASAISDKENSCSPKPQRSRRAVFDSGILSRINSHLRQGINDRSDLNLTRSLDRLNTDISPSSAGNMRRLVSPDLKIQIPGNSVRVTSSANGAVQRKFIVEGRPRSHTDPVSPEQLGAKMQTKSSGLLCLSTSQAAHGAQSSVPSPLSATKPKGRGRARGRCRGKALDIESPSRPGAAAGNVSPQHSLSHHPQANKMEQFSDATMGDGTKSNGRTHHDEALERDGSLPPSKHKGAVPSSEGFSGGAGAEAVSGRDSTDGSPRPSSADESLCNLGTADNGGSQTGGAGGTATGKHNSKALTLKIDRDESLSPVDDPALVSPEDITQLLSPNHEYVIDWAAAMATPPAESSTQSSPHWCKWEQR